MPFFHQVPSASVYFGHVVGVGLWGRECARTGFWMRCCHARGKTLRLRDGGKQAAKMALFSLLLLLLAINSAMSARIAGFVAIGGSQYINTRNTLEELASRGHEV